jgi:hypothetical protein
MSITQHTDNTWSFTHGARSYVGYATREQAAEALYDLERGKQQPGDLVDTALAYVSQDEIADELIRMTTQAISNDEIAILDWIDAYAAELQEAEDDLDEETEAEAKMRALLEVELPASFPSEQARREWVATTAAELTRRVEAHDAELQEARCDGARYALTALRAVLADDELDIAEWISGSSPTPAQLARLHAEIAERKRENIADAPAAAAIVLAHLDQIAKTEEERDYVRTAIAEDMADGGTTIHDWAHRLTDTPAWCGVQTSPGVNRDRASTEESSYTPRLSRDAAGALSLRGGGR